jgi:hypothetical protein
MPACLDVGSCCSSTQLVGAHVWLCVGSEAVMMLLQKDNTNYRQDGGVSFIATQSLHMTLVKDVPQYVYDLIRRD